MIRRVTPAQLAAWRDRVQPHFLYRCYDDDGLLLYIGCTSDVKKRMGAHRRGDKGTSRWLAVSMIRYEVDSDEYAGRIAGQAAEAVAIRAEHPVFNLQHAGGRHGGYWPQKVAHYLIDHGRLDLALATACACWRETLDLGKCDPWCPAHVAEGVLAILPAGEVA